jgi:hypothetical protein
LDLPNETKPLPPVKSWFRLAGPGAIMLATSLGSGEIYFWPNLSANIGAWVLVVAFMAIGLQYVINTEVSRYTVATGETIIRGFDRLWSPLPWIILLCCTIPWVWPGWSMGGATALTWLIGGDAIWYGVASLFLAGFLLSIGWTLYKCLEMTQMFLIGITMVAGLLVFGFAKAYLSAPMIITSFSGQGLIDFAATDVVTILSAFAFCGAGGTINLTQSHYVREKGFGMGMHLPPLLNTILGGAFVKAHSSSTKKSLGWSSRISSISSLKEMPGEESKRARGFLWAPNDTNVSRWQQWWQEVRREQFYNFFVVGCVGLVLLSLIAVKLIGDAEPQSEMDLLVQEMNIIALSSAFLSKIFALIVTLVFFTSEIGVLDHVCRLTADIAHCKRLVRDNNRFWSEGAIYLYALWTMVFGGTFILLGLNISRPPQLLEMAGSLSGIAMFIYSVAIILLNKSAIREWHNRFVNQGTGFNPFKLPVWRWSALTMSCVVFGIFSVLLIISKF